MLRHASAERNCHAHLRQVVLMPGLGLSSPRSHGFLPAPGLMPESPAPSSMPFDQGTTSEREAHNRAEAPMPWNPYFESVAGDAPHAENCPWTMSVRRLLHRSARPVAYWRASPRPGAADDLMQESYVLPLRGASRDGCIGGEVAARAIFSASRPTCCAITAEAAFHFHENCRRSFSPQARAPPGRFTAVLGPALAQCGLSIASFSGWPREGTRIAKC